MSIEQNNKILASDVTNSINSAMDKANSASTTATNAYNLANSKQNALGFTPVQQGGGAYQGTNKIYLGWDGGALRCQVDSTDLGQIITNVNGQTTANYAHSAGQAYPMREGGVRMYMNWSGQGGQPTWLWGGEDGTNMYVYNPANFNVNYANSAWQATCFPNVSVYKSGRGFTIPSGGTWKVVGITNNTDTMDAWIVAGGTFVQTSSGNSLYIAFRTG